MATPSGIHHVNFIVHDLDEAIARFERLLGVKSFETVDHAARGSRVAYCALGESWLVLVSPYDPESIPGRYLAEHGEGIFLLSLSTDKILNPRDGILDWQVEDIGDLYGVQFQRTELKR